MRRTELPEPESIVGNCCGCNRFPRLLFKLPGIYRYRCEECFEREMGYRHHLTPPSPEVPTGPDRDRRE